MDTLAKETMGLPIFICPSNHQIVSSGTFSVARDTTNSAPTSPTSLTTTSTQTSPTTPFFATASATRSPTSQTFSPASAAAAAAATTTTTRTRDARRNTYTPPTFSPDHRRKSLLSTHRLSAAFDLASAFASEVLSKAADQVFGYEQGRSTAEEPGNWNEDLEAGDREWGKEKKERAGRYSRFGEEGAFESWLD